MVGNPHIDPLDVGTAVELVESASGPDEAFARLTDMFDARVVHLIGFSYLDIGDDEERTFIYDRHYGTWVFASPADHIDDWRSSAAVDQENPVAVPTVAEVQRGMPFLSPAQAGSVHTLLQSVAVGALRPCAALETLAATFGGRGVGYHASHQDYLPGGKLGFSYADFGNFYHPTIIFDHYSGTFVADSPASYADRDYGRFGMSDDPADEFRRNAAAVDVDPFAPTPVMYEPEQGWSLERDIVFAVFRHGPITSSNLWNVVRDRFPAATQTAVQSICDYLVGQGAFKRIGADVYTKAV